MATQRRLCQKLINTYVNKPHIVRQSSHINRANHDSSLKYRVRTLSTSVQLRAPPTSKSELQRQTSTTSRPPKTEFLIKIPDFHNASSKRAQAQNTHAKEVQPLVDSGHLTLGSVLLQEHPKEGERPIVVGSIVILKAESEHAVREFLRNDAYTKAGAWDVDRAEIWPIGTGIRTAL